LKLIEGLKKQKELARKVNDLVKKVHEYSADMDYENPVYGDVKAQREKVSEWLQSIHDMTQETLKLRIAVQKTNLETDVTIELGGKAVTKCIAAWIHRHRDLSNYDLQAWRALGKPSLKDGFINQSNEQKREVKVRRYFDIQEKDKNVALYSEEPALITAKLETVNAVTDLIGYDE